MPTCSAGIAAEPRISSRVPWFKVYLAWPRLRSGDPEAYARTIITHANTDWWRRKPWREISTDALPDRPMVTDIAGDLARRDAVVRALAVLTPRERAVLVLRYFYDLQEVDIAAELGCALGTVKSTAARAKAKLKADVNLEREVSRT